MICDMIGYYMNDFFFLLEVIFYGDQVVIYDNFLIMFKNFRLDDNVCYVCFVFKSKENYVVGCVGVLVNKDEVGYMGVVFIGIVF